MNNNWTEQKLTLHLTKDSGRFYDVDGKEVTLTNFEVGMADPKVKFAKTHPDAKAPVKANKTDSGYDLFSTTYVKLSPFEYKAIDTGICLEMPDNFYGRIAPRSGLAFKNGIDVLAGVIDSGYRDSIKVILINFNVLSWLSYLVNKITGKSEPGVFEIKPGTKIAQIIFQKYEDVELVESNSLSNSERGKNGFGSSGV